MGRAMSISAPSNLRGYSESQLYDHLKRVIDDAFRRHRQENEASCDRNGWSMDDFRFEAGEGKVNLLGARGFSKDTMAPVVNSSLAWDDTCFVIYKLNGKKRVESFYLNTEQNSVDKKEDPDGGLSFLLEGNHRYRLGFHKGSQRALEPESVVKTIWDKNQNFVDDDNPGGPQWLSSINIHFGGNGASPEGWSAGCQTIRNQADYDAFRTLVESDTSIIGSIANQFAPKPRKDGTRVLFYTLVDGSYLVGTGTPRRETRHPKQGDRYDKPKNGKGPSRRRPVKDRPTVKRGNSGQPVRALQKRLTRLGHDPGAVDGIFGARTDSAVRSFQRANALTPDGIVGRNTWAALAAGAKSLR